MIISGSQLSMHAATSRAVTSHRSIATRVDPPVPRPAAVRPPTPTGAPGAREIRDTVEIGEAGEVGAAERALPTKLHTLVGLLERRTGHRFRLLDPDEVTGADDGLGARPAAAGPPPGASIEATVARVETETFSFAATGTVSTADGRELAVRVDLVQSRQEVEVYRLQVGPPPQLTDPLVLAGAGGPDFAGTVDFDLDVDGSTEAMPFVASGTAFLVLDRNGNGRVDDGSELFGPATGDGFAELAMHDGDRNGWLDEADAVYSALRLWTTPNGPLTSLDEAGVGAIGLDRVHAEAQLVDGSQPVGVVRSTGVWLGEDGGAGTVHHVDLIT